MPSMLGQPYPFLDSWPKRIVVAVGIGGYVLVFLWYFQPLGMHAIGEDRKVLIFVGFSAVTILACVGSWLILPALFPRRFTEDGWTVRAEIGFNAWIFVTIGLVNYVFAVAFGLIENRWSRLLEIQLVTLLVGVTPVLVYVLVNLIYLLRRHRRDIERLNRSLPRAEQIHTNLPVVLISETGKERVSLGPEELLFIESVDNYVTVHWREHGVVKKVLLRNTLKKVADQLAVHPHLFRCHRTFLINLRCVQSVSGNAQGYRVVLTGITASIPVARSRIRSFRTTLEAAAFAVHP